MKHDKKQVLDISGLIKYNKVRLLYRNPGGNDVESRLKALAKRLLQ